MFGSPANVALEQGTGGKYMSFCTGCVWFMEALSGVAHGVFHSTAVNIQGLGKESGSKDDSLLGVCIPN